MPKIPSHPPTNFTDKHSISLVDTILTAHKRVMPKLQSIDKWPNLDGVVDVQDEKSNYVGCLHVQVKTLPKGHKLQFSCPIEILTFSELQPFLLFCVDQEKKRVYWLYLDVNFLKKVDYKNNTSEKTILLIEAQSFDEKTTGYAGAWEKIIQENRRKYNTFDEMEEAYELLRKNANQAIGKISPSYVTLHNFLDILNGSLEREFKIVKDRLFPSAWKIGIAVYEYREHHLSYMLYPVPTDKNDVLIKEVGVDIGKKIRRLAFGFTAHFVENPIADRAKEYVKEWISSRVLGLVDRRQIDFSGSVFLAQENVFSFLEQYHDRLGLPLKDQYATEEIQKNEWLMQRRNTHLLLINGREVHLSIFFSLLDFLESKKLPIQRVYKKKDFSRIPHGGWIWEVFSKVDAKHNAKLLFDNLPEAYTTVVKNNFPLLEESLSLFGKADKLLVSFDIPETYKGYVSSPTYKMFFVKSEKRDGEKSIEIIDEKIASNIWKKIFSPERSEVEYRGEKYTMLSAKHGALDFLYKDTPLSILINDILRERLQAYFQKN